MFYSIHHFANHPEGSRCAIFHYKSFTAAITALGQKLEAHGWSEHIEQLEKAVADCDKENVFITIPCIYEFAQSYTLYSWSLETLRVLNDNEDTTASHVFDINY